MVSGIRSESSGARPHPGGRADAASGAALGAQASPRGLPTLRTEILLAVEIMALTTLIFSRPVLEILGRNPGVFTERQMTPGGVVLWGAAVVLLPALAVVGIGLISRLAGRRVRDDVHIALVGVLAGLAAWRLGVDYTDLASRSLPLVLSAVAAAVAVGVLRRWQRSSDPVGTFLRYAGIAPLVFLGQFAVASPTGEWIFRPERAVDRDAAESVAAQLDGDAPPVVLVVLDELPTATLLDGEGRIKDELFPNLANLASVSTWYRNHTTVATGTFEALPALVSGKYTSEEDNPLARSANLFTVLSETHEFHVHEPVTDLCPPRYCPRDWRAMPGNVGSLLDKARFAWVESATDRPVLFPPDLDEKRFERAETWISELDLEASDKPPFIFLHVLLPHSPWDLTDDGTRYERVRTYGAGLFSWQDWGTEIGERRHVLQTQATDRLVGLLFDRLEAADMMDDALVVVTADHGYGFVQGEPQRLASADNLHHVLWTPLLIKDPGQREGSVVDDNVELVDVLPTVAKRLGVELPWDVHGVLVSRAAEQRDPGTKTLIAREQDFLGDDSDDGVVEIDASREFARLLGDAPLVPGTGSDAVWERTSHGDLLRQPVDGLRVGAPAGVAVEMREPEAWQPVDTSEPLPLVLVGDADLPAGTVVAFGLNGRIAALGEVEEADEGSLQALALPALFVDGDNELSAYVVEESPAGVTLHPLDLRF